MYTWLPCTFVFMTSYFRYLGHLYGLGTPGVPASSSPTAEEAAKIEEAWVPYLQIFKNSKRIQNYHVQHSCLKNVAKQYQPCENVVLRHCLVFRLFSPLDPRQCLAPPTFSTECKGTDSKTRLKGRASRLCTPHSWKAFESAELERGGDGHDHGWPTGNCEQAVTGKSFKDVHLHLFFD